MLTDDNFDPIDQEELENLSEEFNTSSETSEDEEEKSSESESGESSESISSDSMGNKTIKDPSVKVDRSKKDRRASKNSRDRRLSSIREAMRISFRTHLFKNRRKSKHSIVVKELEASKEESGSQKSNRQVIRKVLTDMKSMKSENNTKQPQDRQTLNPPEEA